MSERKYVKYSTEELMEIIDVFNVSSTAAGKIRELLEKEDPPPDGGVFFRYYNKRSKVEEFERRVREKVGVAHALAVNSGTSALIAALAAAGIGPGDEVIVPAYTFFASVSAIVVARAIPVIVEIDESLTIDPEEIERNITPRTKAIMPVHMIGLPCDMDRIMEIARRRKLTVIEDAAQAFGGKYRGRYLGSIGDLGCVSLDAYKIIGTGEGGLVLTDDEWLHTRAQSWHDTAACWRPDRYARERKSGELFSGENYRMPEICAAVGLAQLRKLDWINDRTRALSRLIMENLRLPGCARWVKPNDPEGACGCALGILFEETAQAVRAIEAGIGLGGLAARATRGLRDWHVYWNWEHIFEKKTVTGEGCPFTCPHVESLPAYSTDMCPRTKDIMMRLALIEVKPGTGEAEAVEFARSASEKLAALFGGER